MYLVTVNAHQLMLSAHSVMTCERDPVPACSRGPGAIGTPGGHTVTVEGVDTAEVTAKGLFSLTAATSFRRCHCERALHVCSAVRVHSETRRFPSSWDRKGAKSWTGIWKLNVTGHFLSVTAAASLPAFPVLWECLSQGIFLCQILCSCPSSLLPPKVITVLRWMCIIVTFSTRV